MRSFRSADGFWVSGVVCRGAPPSGPGFQDRARPQDVANLPVLVRGLKRAVAIQTGATGGRIFYEGVRTYLAFVDDTQVYVSFCGKLTYLDIKSGAAPAGRRFFVAERQDGSHRVSFGEDTADPAKFEHVYSLLCQGREGPRVWR